MKTRLKIVIVLLWFVIAPLYGQDYYSGKASIRGNTNEYVIKDYKDVAIEIWNKNNQYPIYTSTPYFKDTKKEVKTTPNCKPDVKIMTKILETIFTAEERATYNATDNYIDIGVAVEPLTGKVIEVMTISLMVCVSDKGVDKVLLSIPITKLERLEQLIIQRVVLDIPEEYKTANFVPVWFTIFDNRPRINLS